MFFSRKRKYFTQTSSSLGFELKTEAYTTKTEIPSLLPKKEHFQVHKLIT